MNKLIFLRKEINKNETRTPLVPKDIKILKDDGFIIYVQSSENRIYDDKEYEKNGAIITDKNWYSEEFNNFLIIGIKELDNLNKLNKHKHLYFSHCYKRQENAKLILDSFSKSNSIIYDFEYFVNNKKRMIAFGYFAGLVGAILGLKQYSNKIKKIENINNLSSWKSLDDMINFINGDDYLILKNSKIAIIGPEGRCGKGVQFILDKLNLNYIKITKEDYNLLDVDIIYNCILLDETYNKIWFNKETKFNKNLVITDISCDYNKNNNPIKIYNQETTWSKPVFNYNQFVDIIAISNLPSLLPLESSNDFSSKCLDLLLNFENEHWKENLKIFMNVFN